jgi:hypothetical protein
MLERQTAGILPGSNVHTIVVDQDIACAVAIGVLGLVAFKDDGIWGICT